MDAERGPLRAELTRAFADGADTTWPDERFDTLARRIFHYQFERVPAYGAYCRRRGATPDRVNHWTGIPAVPTAAFKEVALAAGGGADAQAVFRTSGTTRGRERRGVHHILELALYHGSLIAAFQAFLLPDGAHLPILSLVPRAIDVPDSSLSHMVDTLMERLGKAGGGHYADPAGGLDDVRLDPDLDAHEAAGTPVLLLGTSLAFAHWLDRLSAAGRRHRLPLGSRLMDTGGFKGRRRQVDAAELRHAYGDRLGVPDDHCVNEYGMTEMLSQLYDAALRDAVRGGAGEPRRKQGPPWVRSLVVDPETLEPLPEGSEGLLRHVDLANLDGVAAIQTEDFARSTGDGLLLLGRAAGAPPRGCSIAMDLLIEAAERDR